MTSRVRYTSLNDARLGSLSWSVWHSTSRPCFIMMLEKRWNIASPMCWRSQTGVQWSNSLCMSSSWTAISRTCHLYDSPKANSATKLVVPLNDADLTTHLLWMCPAKQYGLTKNSTLVSTKALLFVHRDIESNMELNDNPPTKEKAEGADSKRKIESSNSWVPKKAKKGWTEKHYIYCKKHGGAHTTHNTRECHQCNRDGIPKKAGGKSNSKQLVSSKEGMNVAWVICAECKKAVWTAYKKSNHGKRHCSCHEDSDSNSKSDCWSVGLDRQGKEAF